MSKAIGTCTRSIASSNALRSLAAALRTPVAHRAAEFQKLRISRLGAVWWTESLLRSAAPLGDVPEFTVPGVEADAYERGCACRHGASADQRELDVAANQQVVEPLDQRHAP